MTDSDRAFLLAMVAWAEPAEHTDTATGPEVSLPDLVAKFRERLDPARFRTLLGAVNREGWPASPSDQGQAKGALLRLHQAMAHVDLARVHPSWLVRALQEESPAVQRVVAASLADSPRHCVQAGLLLDSADLRSERTAAPEVASWVKALWAERLVGGEPERPDGPPALAMLVRLPPRAGYRLCRMVGICKLIVAEAPPDHQRKANAQTRDDWLSGRLAHTDANRQALALRDVTTIRSSKTPSRHQLARIGLATIARLLADVEPFRLRWALQHWPYPIAKLIRSLLSSAPSPSAALLAGESEILKTAWQRLNLEGRLAQDWRESKESEQP